MSQLRLPEYDAGLLTAARSTADYFEEVLDAAPGGSEVSEQFAKAVSNWMLGEMARLLNQSGQHVSEVKIAPAQIAELQSMVDDSTLSSTMAKTVFERMFETGQPPRQIAESEGLVQISDSDAVEAAVMEAIAANPDPVNDYLSGKQQAMGFLVGQVMKATRGKANPRMASQMVREQLEALR